MPTLDVQSKFTDRSGYAKRYRLAILILLVGLVAYACTTEVQQPTPAPTSEPVTVEVPVPVTVEVTRIVPQQIIVEATPSPPGTCAPATFEETQEIVIGAIVPLSTSGDMLGGFAMQTAFSIAVSELNAAGGIAGLPVRLITYNSAGNAEQAAAYVQRLAREDCAVAITGILHDDVVRAAASRADTLGIPLIVAGATTDDLPRQQYQKVFRIAPSDTMLAEMPAKWITEIGDYNRDDNVFVVILVDSRNLQSADMKRLETELSSRGIKYETVPVDLPSSDFSSSIARVATADHVPDAVIIVVDGEPALELEQQLRVAGVGPHKNSLIVNNESALDSQRFWRTVPDGVGTVVRRVGPWHRTVNAVGQTFALKYASYMGDWPENYAFAAYDSILLLADALERSQSPGGDDVSMALAETDTILASGHYYFEYTAHRTSEEPTPAEHMWNQWPEVHTLYLQYDELGQSSSDMPVVWPERYRSTEGPLAWTPTPPP